MKGKLFLVEWDADVAARQADALRRDGWQVDVESENGGRAYRHIRTSVPDAVVIDLRHRPSHGREVGSALRELRATRSVPIVCIEDGEDAREQTRARIDGVRFSSPETLAWTIADATREQRLLTTRVRSPRTSLRRQR